MSENKFDIFISYQWDIKEMVLQLYNLIYKKVTKKIWLDKFQIKSGTVLFEELKQGIDNSTTILCCITKSYARSQNCQDEFGYSLFTKKPMLILIFEKIDLASDIGWIGFKIVNNTRCNIYKDLDLFKNESGPVYDEMMTSIYSLIGSNNIVKTKEPNTKKVEQANKDLSKPQQQTTEDLNLEFFTIDQLNDIKISGNKSARCNICLTFEFGDKYILWKRNYCDRCFDNLNCSFCEHVFEGTDKIYKGKNNQVYCGKCILDQDLIFNARSFEGNFKEFNKIKCYSCHDDHYLQYFLWNHYYCESCLNKCKKCEISIGNMKYKGSKDYIYCSKKCVLKASTGVCCMI